MPKDVTFSVVDHYLQNIIILK